MLLSYYKIENKPWNKLKQDCFPQTNARIDYILLIGF